jgi:hypothetical protein
MEPNMSLSFKQFNQFASLPEAATDDQINEIFGVFRNNERVEKLKAKQAELLAKRKEKQDQLKKAMSDRKDDKWAAAKQDVEGGNYDRRREANAAALKRDPRNEKEANDILARGTLQKRHRSAYA